VLSAHSSGSKGRRKAHSGAPLLVVTAYACLLTAWIIGNPPFASPDEWAHYLRAVSIGHGQLVGDETGPEGALSIVGPNPLPGMTMETYEAELSWVGQNTRRVQIPSGLTPGWFRCPQNVAYISAACLNDSPPVREPTEQFIATGTYQPLPYLAPALVSRVRVEPDNLSRLMRVSKALMCLALLAAAVALLWHPESGLLPLVGLIVAITPMEMLLASSLNPSGLEIVAGIAFFAALLRLARENTAMRWNWVALGVSGAVLAMSRSPAALWIILDLVVFLALVGHRRAWTVIRQQKPWSVVGVGSVLVGIAVNRVWEVIYGAELVFDPTPIRASLAEGWRQLPNVLMEQIGVFNHLEFGMPSLAYTAWNALVVGLIAIALVVGSRRERIVLAASVTAALALPVLLVATTMRHTGFGLQGRYVLPFSVVVPLLAGEILLRQRNRLRALGAERLFLPFALGAGAIQLVGWWADAHRFAVGRGGPRWFFDKAEWSPPAGWWPWFILASSSAVLLALSEPLDRLLSRAASRGKVDVLHSAGTTARVSR
jgi:hypothetical protein